MRQMCIGKKVPLPKEITDRYVGGQSVYRMYSGFHLPGSDSESFAPRRIVSDCRAEIRDHNFEFGIRNSEFGIRNSE